MQTDADVARIAFRVEMPSLQPLPNDSAAAAAGGGMVRATAHPVGFVAVAATLSLIGLAVVVIGLVAHSRRNG